MLNEKTLLEYLINNGFINYEVVVSGEIKVIDSSRRNKNFKFINKGGTSLLLKLGKDQDTISTLRNEADLYRLFKQCLNNKNTYLPSFYHFDASDNVLLLELFPDAITLRDYLFRKPLSKAISTELGKALALFHSIRVEDGTLQNKDIPWVLNFDKPNIGIFHDLSYANLELIKIIQSYDDFAGHFSKMRKLWINSHLTHNDIKFDNIIFISGKPSSKIKRSTIRVVDWELAGVGDPCWDVGCIFSEFLSFWLLSIPLTGENKPKEALELTKYPLERMQEPMSLFWKAYVERMRLRKADRYTWIMRSIQFSAARLILAAYEYLQSSTKLTGNIILFLQLSLNIIKRPEEAIRTLLGIHD